MNNIKRLLIVLPVENLESEPILDFQAVKRIIEAGRLENDLKCLELNGTYLRNLAGFCAGWTFN